MCSLVNDVRDDCFYIQVFEARTDMRQRVFRFELFRGKREAEDGGLPLDSG